MEAYFKNMKIVELSTVLAGPLVGTFFAELGAEVIKVENPHTGGDPTRQWKLPQEPSHTKYSAYYASANYGKTTVYLDLKKESDLSKFYQYVSEADILITNMLPKVAKKLKTNYEQCIKYNKQIIYAQLYAYEQNTEKPGYDAMMQAECGYISMCGTENDYAKMPVALIDVLASHQLKEAILIALIQNATEGKKARHITVSLYETAIASLVNQASNFLMHKHIPKRLGTQHPNIAPYGDIYRTKDGKRIMIGIGSDSQFDKLKEVLDLSFDYCHSNKQRVKNRKKLNDLIQQEILKRNSEEVEKLFSDKQIPHSFISDLEEVFSLSMARKMVREEVLEGEKMKGVKSIAFKIY